MVLCGAPAGTRIPDPLIKSHEYLLVVVSLTPLEGVGCCGDLRSPQLAIFQYGKFSMPLRCCKLSMLENRK